MSLKPRILYVDDDIVNCDMMTYWLREECGYDVSSAIDGKGALSLIETEFFDLYLLDYCLPDMTAVHLCKRIRRISSNAPIVIYSALDREVDIKSALAAGANHYMLKPDQLFSIKPQIDRLLSVAKRSSTPAPKITGNQNTVVINAAHNRRKAKGIV